MTDEELIARLRDKNCCESPSCNCDAAADRIEALLRELSVSNEIGKAFEEDAGQQRARAEAAEVRADEHRAAEVNEHEWRMNAEAKLIVAEAALAAMTRERDAERETVARLTEALRWYEPRVKACRKFGREGDDARQALNDDGGAAARAALTQKEPTDG